MCLSYQKLFLPAIPTVKRIIIQKKWQTKDKRNFIRANSLSKAGRRRQEFKRNGKQKTISRTDITVIIVLQGSSTKFKKISSSKFQVQKKIKPQGSSKRVFREIKTSSQQFRNYLVQVFKLFQLYFNLVYSISIMLLCQKILISALIEDVIVGGDWQGKLCVFKTIQ